MAAFHCLFAVMALLGVCSAVEDIPNPKEAKVGEILIKTGFHTGQFNTPVPNVLFTDWECNAAGGDMSRWGMGTFDTLGAAIPGRDGLWRFNYVEGMVPYHCPLEFSVLLNPQEEEPQNFQVRHCKVGRSVETLTKAWTFEFKNSDSYLSHCFVSGDEVWISCGEEGSETNPQALCL